MFRTLDHVAVIGPSLDRLAEVFERLGFVLTPPALHMMRNEANGELEPSGTANRCAMLRDGYLELLAVVAPERDLRGISALLARHVGLHLVAFGADQAEAESRRLSERGFASSFSELHRRIEVDGATLTARFTQVRVAPEQMPEARIFGIRHETPELIWHQPLPEHPNGALGLTEILFLVPDIASTTPRYEAFLGVAPSLNEGCVRFALPQGDVMLADAAAARTIYPEMVLQPQARAAAFTVEVEDEGRVAGLLQRNRIPFRADTTGVVVGPEYAGGACCRFREGRTAARSRMT